MSRAESAAVNPTAVSLSDVRARVDAALKKPHPRLLQKAGDDEALRKRLAADPAAADYFRAIKARADHILGEPLLERTMTGRRLLFVSRDCLDRVFALGFAWRVTAEPRYAERAVAEARQVCKFSDWNPSHFLDTAEMSLAVAVCLDWFDGSISPEAREELIKGLIEKGLRTSEIEPNWWVNATNNWGQVCHGGMIAAALAVMEREPELAARIIHRAVTKVPGSMSVYAPDGGYPEGPGYWNYGTLYNIILIDLLESGLGTDFGLSSLPGFDKTGQYVQVMNGPNFENFNYADGWAGKNATTMVNWFARRYGTPVDPAWTTALAETWKAMAAVPPEQPVVRQARFVIEFQYLPEGRPAAGRLPLDWRDRGVVPVSVHRSRWDDPRAIYAGIKAGSPAQNHGQMDSGSFVLDADGVRWAVDLGAEDYHRIESRGMNLWDRKQESDRWRIFRQSTASHNTLMINGRQQIAAGDAPITAFSADPGSPHTTVDLTSLYADQASKVVRTLSLPERKRVEIKDRLEGLKAGSRVRWGMVTRAAIRVEGARAELRQSGEKMTMEASGNVPLVWTVIDTAKPRAEFDSPNPGTAMLAFEAVAPDSGILEFNVKFTPGP